MTDDVVLCHQDAVQSENLQVYLRVRPFTAAESDKKEAQVGHTHMPDDWSLVSISIDNGALLCRTV